MYDLQRCFDLPLASRLSQQHDEEDKRREVKFAKLGSNKSATSISSLWLNNFLNVCALITLHTRKCSSEFHLLYRDIYYTMLNVNFCFHLIIPLKLHHLIIANFVCMLLILNLCASQKV